MMKPLWEIPSDDGKYFIIENVELIVPQLTLKGERCMPFIGIPQGASLNQEDQVLFYCKGHSEHVKVEINGVEYRVYKVIVLPKCLNTLDDDLKEVSGVFLMRR